MTVFDASSTIARFLPEPHAGLLSGIVFGTKATLSGSLYQALVSTGTIHITALSGFNITILAIIVNIFLLWFVSRKVASTCTIGCVIAFILFVGPSPSIVRAALMGTISLLAVIFGKQYWALLSWLGTVFFMLLIRFEYLFDISFQLSASATLGIILFTKQKKLFSYRRSAQHPLWSLLSLKEKFFWFTKQILAHFWSLIEDDLSITLAAQSLTIPLLLFHFHRISLLSPISNLLIGWTLPILTALGLAIAFIGYYVSWVGQMLAFAVWPILQFVISVVNYMSRIPFASVGW